MIMEGASWMTERDRTPVNARIAARVRELRAEQGLTLAALAARCAVSRSMISLVERGEASPTAVVLEKLAAGLGVPLAGLFDEPGGDAEPQPLARRADQAEWRDPASGYLRRSVSPPRWRSPLQLVEVEFPAGARVAYETGAREPPVHQQVWVLSGGIEIALGGERHRLAAGDCLAMCLDRPVVFVNRSRRAARYLVAVASEGLARPGRT
jgi:transcriptional regulator with XRE-family HTH domain